MLLPHILGHMNDTAKVLVTGGAGFIGSHIVDRLVAEGYQTTVLDNLSTGMPENLKQHDDNRSLRFVSGDIRNLDLVRHVVKGVDLIVHEAAQVSVPTSVDDPSFTNDVNVNGTLNLLMAASDEKVRRFVFASSCAVYGDSKLPTSEDSPLKPLSPYAASKIAGEAYCTAFYKTKGLPIVCLRYFNVFGSRQHSQGYASAVQAFMRSAIERKPMTIFGDGTQTRDFLHVDSLVEANMLALDKHDAIGETFNIGSGISTSIIELSEMVREVSGVDAPVPIYLPQREGDIKHSLSDITKARNILGYKPRVDIRSDLKNLFGILTNH